MTLKYVPEFGDGWKDLVEATLARIESIDPEYEVLQIKEKFGSLRWYGESSYEHGTPNAMLIGTLIRDTEKRSESICEQCGLPGRLMVRKGWFFTACTKHAGDAILAEDD